MMINKIPLPEIRRSKLKKLLFDHNTDLIRFLESHNGLSGLIAEKTSFSNREFHGLWVSGLTESASGGLPDVELMGMSSRLAVLSQLSHVTTKPILVDGDTGGSIEQLKHFVQDLENRGASGVIFEDKVFPKNNSLALNKPQVLENPIIFSNKIQAAKEMVKSDDFLVIARIESLIAGNTVEDALYRAALYLEADADAIVIHSRNSNPKEIFDFSKKYHENFGKFKKPLIAIPTIYNSVYEQELYKAGFKIVIHANHMLRASFKAMSLVAKRILEMERSYEADRDFCAPLTEVFSIIEGADQNEQLDRKANSQPTL